MTRSNNKLQQFCRTIFLATIFLLPLKLGSMLLPGIPHALPEDLFAAIINPLPTSFFTIWSALMLLITLAAYGFPAVLSWKNPAGKLLLLFLLLPIAALLGFVNPDNVGSAIIELEYLLGVSSFAAAAAIIMHSEPLAFRNKIANSIAAGTICTAIAGAYQYFYGFDELKKFIEAQEKLHNITFPPELKARAYDVRTYATFTFASALAGFLALAGAFTVVKAFRWGDRFEPVKLSQKLFAVLAFILAGGIFLTTKGRSAFLAVIAAAAITGFIRLKSRKLKLLIFAAAVAVIVAGAYYIHYAGRGFGSMTERVGYLQTSVKMLIAHPFCGGGWGSFAGYHALYKNFGNEELAKDPHNIIAAFASQTGAVGGLLIALLLIFTLCNSAKRMKQDFSPENMAIFFGLSAFSLHILMDLDWQVPALMAYYTVFAFLACGTNTDQGVQRKKIPAILLMFSGVIAAIGGIHWLLADNSFGAMLSASGQEIGTYSVAKSSYEVDLAAEKALTYAPYSAVIYNAWALDKLRRNELLQAEKLFLKTIEIAPKSHAAHKSLSNVYTLLGKKDLAAKHAQIADRLFPYRNTVINKQKVLQNE